MKPGVVVTLALQFCSLEWFHRQEQGKPHCSSDVSNDFSWKSQEMTNWRNQFADAIQKWLFRPGGKYNIAICRVVIATALYLTLSDGNFSWLALDWQYWVSGRSDWAPKGIVKLLALFHEGPPAPWLPKTAYYLGMGAIAAMAVGFLGRISQVVATICAVSVVSQRFHIRTS
ncbi:MAG TPA: hypothetical protein PLJ46_18965 [Burkholderiaceae bacterium]|nr:hypothetical protein [Burkholderiaceae bacterium]HQZ07969.1 hypothetical protein [Burkholderiaceae bacterium]